MSFENAVPVRVRDGERILPVESTSFPGFYWIGTRGSNENAQKILDSLNQTADQGVCIVAERGNDRMLGIRIGSMIFGEMLPESTVKENEKK